jgi:hypothetical protein
MSISASLFAMVLPGSASLAAILLRAVPFAPIGAICALTIWRLREGRALSMPHRTLFICLAAVLGGFLAALLDLAIAALRPDIGLGVTGGDIIIGAATGALAGHIGALKPIVRT